MTVNTIQTAFVGGEVSPGIYGRIDLAKYKIGASTMRNIFANYRGGASSRAGTSYVGMCKQAAPNAGGTATSNPPRDITFQFNLTQGYALEFGDQYMRIKSNGAYVVETGTTISAITKANPGVFTDTAHGYNNGDWIFITGVGGMTNFNGLIWIVQNKTTNTYTVTDLFGTAINTTAFPTFTTSGIAQRIYTVVSPYAAIDLPYLKFTQSADTMSLACVNQITLTEYPPYDLQRVAATNWTFTQVTFAAGISPPATPTAVANNSTTVTTWYSYVVTSVDAVTGEESVASNPCYIENNDIAINAGSNTVSWNAVTGASSYNVYAATPSYSEQVPIGAAYGFVGSTIGVSFTDSNITADFTTVPPTHQNPFARGQITDVVITAPGTGYAQSTIGYTITTVAGTGFAGTPIVDASGAVTGFAIANNGEKYAPGDTITITTSGGGSGATATLTFGAQTGTYPGVVAYYQQRRVYAYSLNAPDTYWMSKPGSYKNFDSSIPTVDDDAITGTPWAQQVNGIQFLVPVQSNLVTLTGSGAWSLNGGNNAAITAADQTATAQAYNGCNSTVFPLVVNYDILYVQAKGSIVRDLSYNFFVNIYTGTDMTVLSNHLFIGHKIIQWAYCEEPYKLIWAVRDDGIILCLTYLKEQDVYAWSRHDTNGQYVGVTSVTEPPVDALYTLTQRLVRGHYVYYSERMDNRIWENVEDCFCVDAGLQWPMTFPNATLFIFGVTGTVTLTASASVFSAGNVGEVVRAGGGKMTITAYTSGTSVTASVTQTVTGTTPDDPKNTPLPVVAGNWSMTSTTSVVTGLNHLEGMTVAILADGSVVPNQVVTNGAITLPQAYSAITIGLPYLPQLQTLYLDAPIQGGTMQGKRKDIQSVTVRVEASRGWSVGSNQPDQSTQPNNATIPWKNMFEVKQRNALVTAGSAIPLFTGDLDPTLIPGDWASNGQVAIQQSYPLPLNITAVIPNYSQGDMTG